LKKRRPDLDIYTCFSINCRGGLSNAIEERES
jgi:hypothetical protein